MNIKSTLYDFRKHMEKVLLTTEDHEIDDL